MIDTLNHVRALSRYNAWANRRLYDAASTLTPEDWQRDTGLYFRSLQGTLNHLLVADRIWLRRLDGQGPVHTRLDEIVHAERADLRIAREAEDARIQAFVDGLTAERLAGELAYANTSGARFVQRLWDVLAHVFNHQTHHRGHAHAGLTRLGKAPPELDLLYYQRMLMAQR